MHSHLSRLSGMAGDVLGVAGSVKEPDPGFKLQAAASTVRPPKLRRDWVGQKVRLKRALSTSVMVVPVGTVCTVRYAHNGADLTTEPCGCCGVKIHVSKVGWSDLEFLGEGRANG